MRAKTMWMMTPSRTAFGALVALMVTLELAAMGV
jgi:hypothetical protein